MRSSNKNEFFAPQNEKTPIFNKDRVKLGESLTLQISYLSKKCAVSEKGLNYRGCGFTYPEIYVYCPNCGCENRTTQIEFTEDVQKQEFNEEKTDINEEIPVVPLIKQRKTDGPTETIEKSNSSKNKNKGDDGSKEDKPITCNICKNIRKESSYDYCKDCQLPFDMELSDSGDCMKPYSKNSAFCPHCGYQNIERKSLLFCHHCMRIEFIKEIKKDKPITCNICKNIRKESSYDYCKDCQLPFGLKLCYSGDCMKPYSKNSAFCPHCGYQNIERKSLLFCHHCMRIKFRNRDAICVSPFCGKKNPTNKKECQTILPPHLPTDVEPDSPITEESVEESLGKNERKILKVLLKNGKNQRAEELYMSDLSVNKLTPKEIEKKLTNYILTYGYPRSSIKRLTGMVKEDVRKNADELVMKGLVSEVFFNGERKDETTKESEGRYRVFYILNIQRYNERIGTSLTQI